MTITALSRQDIADRDHPRWAERLGSAGRAYACSEVMIADADDRPLPCGEAGEVLCRGVVMRGYWRNAEASAATLKGGWLHTGDIAREDEHGFYTIVDRKKDMIVTGGFNVFPREIEDVISSHPAVANVAVIGVPDDRWGEAVKAVVVVRPGESVDAGELVELVKAAKGSVQAPKSVDFADEIPLSPLGKPDKKALRAQYWQGTNRQVH
jgi:fatty-acyl-CoA synthase